MNVIQLRKQRYLILAARKKQFVIRKLATRIKSSYDDSPLPSILVADNSLDYRHSLIRINKER